MNVSEPSIRTDSRLHALTAWLDTLGMGKWRGIQSASGDASFRRYFRAWNGEKSFIIMDAPPERENSERFVRIAAQISAMGLTAPEVIAQNLEEGFLLLSDLGSTQYLDVLESDSTRTENLYLDAVNALRILQKRGADVQSTLPPYDEKLLRFELSIFREWLCEMHLGINFSAEEETQWHKLCDALVENALAQPKVFVHRDFHSRNLMVLDENNPGILDFQDALEGPLTYDLVSLLKDCYFKLSPTQVKDWTRAFCSGLDGQISSTIDEDQFVRFFDLMGVQRHLKAAGIFARLNHRDGKPGYLGDIPRTLGYIVELSRSYDELNWVGTFIASKVLPRMEAVR